MSKTPFRCPNCGSETFKVSGKIETMNDMRGAVCSQCGRAFSEEDVREHARKIANNAIREALKGFKLS